ncbi:MAG TPA: sodium/proton-translocating pyrophosphatase, partial [Bacteroidota bacterium]
MKKLLDHFYRSSEMRRNFFIVMMVLFAAAYFWQPSLSRNQETQTGTETVERQFVPFSLFSDPKYKPIEIVGLVTVLCIAIGGLLYALMLVKQVRKADQGTTKMQEIAAAVREGANAYLGAQFKKIGPLIIVITVLLFFTYTGTLAAFRWGRAGAFLLGSLFSWTVGFVGMRLATQGNLRVATAAKRSYGEALQLGYRTGTITGMLTDGLGLLGGTMIFLLFGDQAYEALLGFGFGGTLLALFMRVGGGIYTKA